MHRTLAEGLTRRRTAALRLPPLECGNRDPLYAEDRTYPMKQPSTTLHAAMIGGTITRDEANAAWHAYPEHRELLLAAVNAQRDGWKVAA